MSKTYEYQWNRVNRKYQSFIELDSGKIHDHSSDYYEDIVYDFFIHCHQLKDWIKNDSNINQKIKSQVEGYINSNHELEICADIANCTKHMVQKTNQVRSGEEREVKKKTIGLTLGEGDPKVQIKYEINDGGHFLDAFTLATTCVNLWTNFIKNNSLEVV